MTDGFQSKNANTGKTGYIAVNSEIEFSKYQFDI